MLGLRSAQLYPEGGALFDLDGTEMTIDLNRDERQFAVDATYLDAVASASLSAAVPNSFSRQRAGRASRSRAGEGQRWRAAVRAAAPRRIRSEIPAGAAPPVSLHLLPSARLPKTAQGCLAPAGAAPLRWCSSSSIKPSASRPRPEVSHGVDHPSEDHRSPGSRHSRG